MCNLQLEEKAPIRREMAPITSFPRFNFCGGFSWKTLLRPRIVSSVKKLPQYDTQHHLHYLAPITSMPRFKFLEASLGRLCTILRSWTKCQPAFCCQWSAGADHLISDCQMYIFSIAKYIGLNFKIYMSS